MEQELPILDALKPFERYLNRCVAVQLRFPVVEIDNVGVIVPDTDQGQPQIVTDARKQMAASVVLCGKLLVSLCKTRLLLFSGGATNAIIETLIDPKDVAVIRIVTKIGKPLPPDPPEDSPLIVVPHVKN